MNFPGLPEAYLEASELDLALVGLTQYYAQSATGKAARECKDLLHKAFWSSDGLTAYAACLALSGPDGDTPEEQRWRARIWRGRMRPHLVDAKLLDTLRLTVVHKRNPYWNQKQRDAWLRVMMDAVPYWDAHFQDVS